MMNPAKVLKYGIMPVLECLGETEPRLNNIAAARMILAAAVQESQLTYRHQIGGPAHGFAQDEPIGAAEALRVDRMKGWHFLEAMGLPQTPVELHRALEFSEWAMVISARLKLWPLPERLPLDGEEQMAWEQYQQAWRPGKPHPHRWNHSWVTACQAVRDLGL